MPLQVILPHAMKHSHTWESLGDGQWLLADLWAMQVFRDRLPLQNQATLYQHATVIHTIVKSAACMIVQACHVAWQ